MNTYIKYNVKNQPALLRDPHATVPKFLQDHILFTCSPNQFFVLHLEHPPHPPPQLPQLFPFFLSFQILRAAATTIASTTSPTTSVPIFYALAFTFTFRVVASLYGRTNSQMNSTISAIATISHGVYTP